MLESREFPTRTPNKVRVQKHRAKLRAEYCRRLDVWIGLTVIQNVRQIAKHKKLLLWEVVQDALEAYVTGHAGEADGNNRL